MNMRSPNTDVLSLVKPEFHDAFTRFVDTGELDESFAEFLNNDPGCQKAIEAIATEQLDSLRAFGQSLRDDPQASEPASARLEGAPRVRIPDTDPRVNELYAMVAARTAAASPAQGQELRRALATRLVAGE